jgi:hypothetical protein
MLSLKRQKNMLSSAQGMIRFQLADLFSMSKTMPGTEQVLNTALHSFFLTSHYASQMLYNSENYGASELEGT